MKVAFAHPAAAHVLVDKDVAGLLELLRRPQMLRILVLAVRPHAVRRAVHQERIRPAGRILRHIHRGEQPLAVAHRNAVLVLGVVRRGHSRPRAEAQAAAPSKAVRPRQTIRPEQRKNGEASLSIVKSYSPENSRIFHRNRGSATRAASSHLHSL